VGAALAAFVVVFAPSAIPARFKAEHWAADWRTALLSVRLPSSHPHFVLVGVTAKSLEKYKYFLPIHREHLADIVDAANSAGASAIGLDFFFTRDTEDRADARLLEALKRARDKVVLGVYEVDLSENHKKYQYDLIEATGVRAGYIDLIADKDRVVRYRASPSATAKYRHSFSSVLVGQSDTKIKTIPPRIAWLLPPKDNTETFMKISSNDLLELPAEKRATLLRGRIVLVGGELFTLDRHWTPLSLRTEDGMLGLEIHAHMASELRDANRSYTELSAQQSRVLIGALALLGFALGTRFHGRKWDYLDWGVASFFVIGADLIVFKFFHIILPFTLSALGWITGVTAGTQLNRANVWLARWRS
jgi:CHASE2 domain-containing sensor protein